MNHFQNPHTQEVVYIDNQGRQIQNPNMAPMSPNGLPYGHPYGPMVPPSAGRPFYPAPPQVQQMPQRGPVIQPGGGWNQQMPMQNGLRPGVDPRMFQQPQGQYPAPDNSQGRFGNNNNVRREAYVEQVIQPVQPIPQPLSPKAFMMFQLPQQNFYKSSPDSYRVNFKKAAIDANSHEINKAIAASDTLETALDATIESMCAGSSLVYTQLLRFDNSFYRADHNHEVFNIFTATTAKDMIAVMNEYYRTVKSRDFLVVLNAVDSYMVGMINDILLISNPNDISIQDFRSDYFELMDILTNQGQTALVAGIEKFVRNQRDTFEPVVIEYAENALKRTTLTEYISVTAIDATAYEARLEHVGKDVVLMVTNAPDSMYLHSIMASVKKNFVDAPVEAGTCDRSCVRHYLATVDKRWFEMMWSVVDGTPYIRRLG